jgi:hypothetical protein
MPPLPESLCPTQTNDTPGVWKHLGCLERGVIVPHPNQLHCTTPPLLLFNCKCLS